MAVHYRIWAGERLVEFSVFSSFKRPLSNASKSVLPDEATFKTRCLPAFTAEHSDTSLRHHRVRVLLQEVLFSFRRRSLIVEREL